jgi:PAS domain S-box-containing protein
MPQSEPITFLILNEHAEEIKLATISLRGFFSDLRVEVAYSVEEAERMTQADTSTFAVVLIDEGSLRDAPSTFVSDLKRRAAYAAIVFQSSRTEAGAVREALDMGADLFLYKHSPAFLIELLCCTKDAIDKRAKQVAAERAETRHAWLLESLDDVLYELDAEGRFLSLSRDLPTSLGYRAEELIGRPYSTLLPETEQRLACYRFNERRAGDRAVKNFAVTLRGKATAEGEGLHAPALLTARGLYDASRRFVGTIGLIRNLPGRMTAEAAEQELRQQRQRDENLHALIGQMAELSQRLEQPLSAVLHESRQLSDILRESRLLDRLQALTGEAAASVDLAQQLTRLAPPGASDHVVNRLLRDVLPSASPDAGPDAFIAEFGSALPPYTGDLQATARFFSRLLAYAGAYLRTVGRPQVAAVKTSDGGVSGPSDAPTLFPLTPSATIHLEITETAAFNASAGSLPAPKSLDVGGLYALAQELGATLDLSAPASGPFRMTVRLPAGTPPPVRPVELKVPDRPRPDARAQTPVPPPAADSTAALPTEPQTSAPVETALPAKITKGSMHWEGTVISLSVDGAAIRVSEDFPAMAAQEAIVSIVTSIATLQLDAVAAFKPGAPGAPQDAQLTIQFQESDQTETAILASLIAAARERALSFTLDIRMPVRSGMQEYGRPSQPVAFDLAEHDRRESLRVSTALPARLATMVRQEPGARLPAQVINLSRSGVCILVQERPDTVTGTVQLYFAPAHRTEPPSHEPGAPDAVLAAHVIWAATDAAAPGGYQAPHMSGAHRIGLRFEPLTPYAERELNRVIRQHLRAQRSGEAITVSTPVVTVPRECRNARGQTIAIMDDHWSQPSDQNRPVIIVSPGFGQTAADYTALAYYLAQHQFRLLRYDPTNHLGNSEGELQQTTVRSMQHDLEQVIEFVRHTWPQAPIVVIASDLAARAALKVAAHTKPLDLLLLINPAIDPAATLMTVHGHDLIADYQFGLRRGVCNLLGLNVNIDQFVGDLVAGRCADLESTLEDLRMIRSPLCIATSPADSLAMPPTDLPHAFMTALGTQTRLVNISSPVTDRHLEMENTPPAVFKQLLKQIGSALSMQALPTQDAVAVQPYVARQQRLEQEYTFLRHDGSQINREALCAGHLAHLPHLGNLHEYRKLLDDLYGLMSPLEPGSALVDAGVGQSDLTRAALINHTYRAGQSSWTGRPAPVMIGVGRSRERVSQSRHAVLVLQRELATGFVGRLSAMPPLAIGWLQADWMNALPFKSGSVSRLVCNLSLPYVPSPLAAVREWHRVLHPDGSLILTAFHPNTDLSPLYRRHLRQANQDEFSVQAQPLLHYFARLREAIRHRILHTFNEDGLAALLRQCGIASFRILPIWDGQALVAIVGKQNSSSSLR